MIPEHFFEPLKIPDIVEKVTLNLQKGLSLKAFRDMTHYELCVGERLILKVKSTMLDQEIQNQNLREQLKVIDCLIQGGKNGSKPPDKH